MEDNSKGHFDDEPLESRRRPIVRELISGAVRAVLVTGMVLLVVLLLGSFPVLGYLNLGGKFEVFPKSEASTGFDRALSFLKESPFQKTDGLEKWNSQIKIKYNGSYTDKEIEVLGKIVAGFNTIPGFPGMKVVSKGENVTVSYISSAEFSKYADQSDKEANDPTSFCSHTSKNGVISSAHIVIVKKWPQGYENSEVLHEFFHLVGFYSHTEKRDSILNKIGPVASLSATDVLAFKMIYNPNVKVGWTYGQLANYYSKADITDYVSPEKTQGDDAGKPSLVIPMLVVAFFLMVGFFGALKRSGVVIAGLSLLTGCLFSAVTFGLFYLNYDAIIAVLLFK